MGKANCLRCAMILVLAGVWGCEASYTHISTTSVPPVADPDLQRQLATEAIADVREHYLGLRDAGEVGVDPKALSLYMVEMKGEEGSRLSIQCRFRHKGEFAFGREVVDGCKAMLKDSLKRLLGNAEVGALAKHARGRPG